MVSRSTKNICNNQDVLIIQNYIPAHFTTSNDLKHWSTDNNDGPTFSHKDEVFNEHFLQQLSPASESDNLMTTKINIFSACWNVLQSLFIAYGFFRMHTMRGLVFQLAANNIPGANASPTHYCKLPQDAYYLMITILVFVY